jgi:hypothetical protein
MTLTTGESSGVFKDFVKLLVGKVKRLSDLVARIAATDWLIAQAVHDLYGPEEDEIAIVEGAG